MAKIIKRESEEIVYEDDILNCFGVVEEFFKENGVVFNYYSMDEFMKMVGDGLPYNTIGDAVAGVEGLSEIDSNGQIFKVNTSYFAQKDVDKDKYTYYTYMEDDVEFFNEILHHLYPDLDVVDEEDDAVVEDEFEGDTEDDFTDTTLPLFGDDEDAG